MKYTLIISGLTPGAALEQLNISINGVPYFADLSTGKVNWYDQIVVPLTDFPIDRYLEPSMQIVCPDCGTTKIRKNGITYKNKQQYQCLNPNCKRESFNMT